MRSDEFYWIHIRTSTWEYWGIGFRVPETWTGEG